MHSEQQENEQLRKTIEELSHQIILGQEREEKVLAEFSAMNNELITTHRLLAKSSAGWKEAKEQADRARHDAEAANAAKSGFVAMVSHEIRAPLNGIMGMTELLKLSGMPEEQQEQLGVIADSADYLLHILNNLLDLSKIDAGKMEMEIDPVPLDIREMLRRVLQMLAPNADKRGNRLHVAVGSDVQKVLKGDSPKIMQILINLINNAIKFTGNGDITVSVTVTAEEQASQSLRFEVADTGIGISAKDKEKLFQPYSQVQGKPMSLNEGTGLGLSISKSLVELMGGVLGVDSEPGAGSVFWFELKLDKTSAAAGDAPRGEAGADSAAEEENAASERSVLLVEDHPLNSTLLLMQLEKLGVPSVRHVVTGSEAVEAWQNGSYGLILMDSQLPDISGAEAAARIRELEASSAAGRTPIVAVTGEASEESRRLSMEAGMDDWIAKPLKLAHMRSILDKWLWSGGESIPVINEEAVMGIAELDEEDGTMLYALLEMFRKDTPQRLGNLREAIAGGNAGEAGRIAHSLKSGSLGIGADYFASLCADMERLARDGRLEAAEALLPRLALAYEKSCEALACRV